MSANAAASEPDTLGPPHPVAESRGRRHLYEVDIVRLLTFVCVVGVHAVSGSMDPDNVASGAFVSLLHFTRGTFFLLSAFVLTYALGSKPVEVRRFWPRRFLSRRRPVRGLDGHLLVDRAGPAPRCGRPGPARPRAAHRYRQLPPLLPARLPAALPPVPPAGVAGAPHARPPPGAVPGQRGARAGAAGADALRDVAGVLGDGAGQRPRARPDLPVLLRRRRARSGPSRPLPCLGRRSSARRRRALVVTAALHVGVYLVQLAEQRLGGTGLRLLAALGRAVDGGGDLGLYAVGIVYARSRRPGTRLATFVDQASVASFGVFSSTPSSSTPCWGAG